MGELKSNTSGASKEVRETPAPKDFLSVVEHVAVEKAKHKLRSSFGKEVIEEAGLKKRGMFQIDSPIKESEDMLQIVEGCKKAQEIKERIAEKAIEAVALAAPGGQVIAVEAIAKDAAKEAAKLVAKEIAKNAAGRAVDATESDSLQSIKPHIEQGVSKASEVCGIKIEGIQNEAGDDVRHTPGEGRVKFNVDRNAIAKLGGLDAFRFFGGDLNDVFLKGFVNSEGLTKHIPREGGEWTGVEGDSVWKPDRNEIPKKCNSEGTTWGKILDDNGVEGIEFKDGEPDFSSVSKGTVQIDGFSTNRDRVTAVGEDEKRYTVDEGNYHRADCALAEQWNAEARDGRTDWTYEDVEDYRQENKLTWHECGNQKTMMLVDSRLHANVPHSGGISAAKNT